VTEARLARIDDLVAEAAGRGTVPGLVVLVARGDDVHVAAAGSRSVGGPPMTRDTPFRISSTTKPITGAVTLALAGEGLFGLDEPVGRLLPELAAPRVLRRPDGPLDDTVLAARPITVRDLLTFTFGLGLTGDMFASPEPWPVHRAAEYLHLATLGPPAPAEQPDPDSWIAALGSLPLLAQPGERWLYNTGAQVLGVLGARAAGMPIDEVFRTRIFEPLGMHSTAFWAGADRLPTAYRPTPEGLAVWDHPGGQWSSPPAFGDAAAGLVSTADDLLAFARMLLRGGAPVLSPDGVGQMTKDQLTPEQRGGAGAFFDHQSWGFCQGVVIDGPRAGAYGWDGGLGTSWLVDPVRDLVVIVLTQRLFENPRTPALHRDLQAAAYAAASGG
jgi:CubicO group peptidase (beta-lactamase class C family)